MLIVVVCFAGVALHPGLEDQRQAGLVRDLLQGGTQAGDEAREVSTAQSDALTVSSSAELTPPPPWSQDQQLGQAQGFPPQERAGALQQPKSGPRDGQAQLQELLRGECGPGGCGSGGGVQERGADRWVLMGAVCVQVFEGRGAEELGGWDCVGGDWDRVGTQVPVGVAGRSLVAGEALRHLAQPTDYVVPSRRSLWPTARSVQIFMCPERLPSC